MVDDDDGISVVDDDDGISVVDDDDGISVVDDDDDGISEDGAGAPRFDWERVTTGIFFLGGKKKNE